MVKNDREIGEEVLAVKMGRTNQSSVVSSVGGRSADLVGGGGIQVADKGVWDYKRKEETVLSLDRWRAEGNGTPVSRGVGRRRRRLSGGGGTRKVEYPFVKGGDKSAGEVKEKNKFASGQLLTNFAPIPTSQK